MFPFNSNPFRLRLFQSQKLYNNLCKLYAIFLAWFKIHGFLEAKYIFSEKLILSSFKWDIALITSVNTVDKKNKRKKVTIICHFFQSTIKSISCKTLLSLNQLIGLCFVPLLIWGGHLSRDYCCHGTYLKRKCHSCVSIQEKPTSR